MMGKMKTTAPVSSVGADGVQPNEKNHNEIIANPQKQINQQATKKRRNPGVADCKLCPCRNCTTPFLCREYRL